jgi:hypothetical protein
MGQAKGKRKIACKSLMNKRPSLAQMLETGDSRVSNTWQGGSAFGSTLVYLCMQRDGRFRFDRCYLHLLHAVVTALDAALSLGRLFFSFPLALGFGSTAQNWCVA